MAKTKDQTDPVKHITSKEDFHKILKEAGDKLVVVDFTATWCGPCRRIAPAFEELAAEYTDCVFLKVDIDEYEDVAAECEVTSMPTFQFYKNNKKMCEFSGANEDKLKHTVEKYK